MTHYKTIVKPSVYDDLELICEYYDSLKIIGLTQRFLEDYSDTLDRLSIFPKYEIKYDNIRLMKFSKFPYYVHFQVNDLKNTVIIIAITHTSKDFLNQN